MNKESFFEKLNEYGRDIDQALEMYCPALDAPQHSVVDAMRYSLFSGGKRLRPILTLAFCELCKGDKKTALPFACAVEMIHTYSLIHDDLPCMDNDTLRRGKPTCHVAYGEATALLAGDALLTQAFGTISRFSDWEKISVNNIVEAIKQLSFAANTEGMIGGQVLDLNARNCTLDAEQIQMLYALKTGALIRSAALLGCLAANASEEQKQAAVLYADKLGLAFQIMDDILDVTGDIYTKPEQHMPSSDEANHQFTYVSLHGVAEAQKRVVTLTAEAKGALSNFANTDFLEILADYLSSRDH